MDKLIIPEYTDEDLKEIFTPNDCVEILKHLGYRIKNVKKQSRSIKNKAEELQVFPCGTGFMMRKVRFSNQPSYFKGYSQITEQETISNDQSNVCKTNTIINSKSYTNTYTNTYTDTKYIYNDSSYFNMSN